MPVRLGDTIPLVDLKRQLELCELQLMNTGLFTKATCTLKNWEGETNRIQLQVELLETWYIYPFPIFELADRNFNVWWVEQKRSLRRVNFGVEFSHFNFTGHRDKLKFFVKYGYTENYTLKYNIPYINKKQTLGISTELAYFKNREVNYATINNRQEFYRDDDNFLSTRFLAELGLNFRPKLWAYHDFIFTFRYNKVSDIIKELNPQYFLGGSTQQRYFSLAYHYSYDMRDMKPYPIDGYRYGVSVVKDGLGVFDDFNNLQLSVFFNQYIPVTKKWSFAYQSKARISAIRSRQPYNGNRAIGFSKDALRGYEFYIVDGLDMAYVKTSIRFELINRVVKFGKLMPLKAFKEMPIRAYFSFNNDLGYVNDPFFRETNFLNNSLMWGGGVGVDLIFYYDKVFRLEYSVNQLMEKGLFLHLNLNI